MSIAGLVFVFILVRKWGIFARHNARRRQRSLLEPTSGSRSDIDYAKPRPKTWFRSSLNDDKPKPSGEYRPWKRSLAITKSAKDQLDGLASSAVPLSVLLYNTDPPTLKVNKSGSTPAIMFLRQVNDLENFPSYYQNLPKGIVGTWHNHVNDATMKNHDRRIFETIDKLVGPLVHVIAAKGRWQIYSAIDGPVFSRDRTEAGNQEANRNGKLA